MNNTKLCATCYQRIFTDENAYLFINKQTNKKGFICDDCHSLLHGEYDTNDYSDYEAQMMVAHIFKVMGLD